MTRWKLDKKVSITLVVTMLLQTATAVWWAAKIDSSDTTQNVTIAKLEGEMAATRDANSRQTTAILERLAKVETLLEAQNRLMERFVQGKAR